jgi:beta-1,4-mannosyltransferase
MRSSHRRLTRVISGPRVLVFPAYRDNPYLNILGLAPRAAGYRFKSATRYDELLVRLEGLETGDILHLHWTAPLLQTAPSAAEADERFAALRSHVDRLTSRGVRLVWTVHNRLPHELRHHQAEVALYRWLAVTADVTHIMSPYTEDVLSDVCELRPDTVVRIPHPSFAGVYGPGPGRAAARDSFGLAADDHAILFLGHIRPYKGLSTLIAAAAKSRPEHGRSTVLMIAGGVADDDHAALESAIPPGLRTVLHPSFVADTDIARWMTAADVAVYPYESILNSGSVHLAATFALPVILPDEPHLRGQYGSRTWVRFFDTVRAVDTLAALLSDSGLFADVRTEDFEAFTADISPWTTSRRYRELLDRLTTPPARRHKPVILKTGSEFAYSPR